MKLGLILGGFVVLAVAALTGWTRHVGATPASSAPVAGGMETPCVAPAALAPPVTQDQDNQPSTNAVPPVYATLPYGSSSTYDMSSVAAPASQYVESSVVVAQERVIRHEYVPAPRRARVSYHTRTRHRRPFSHSVAIVGGSAAAGAGIGALAGGGRGAGIGALAGGTGGLIYDRLTH